MIKKIKNHYEVIIIGSGAGGAVTAATLAEAGKNVLLIEEGPFLPLSSCPPFSIQEMLQKYRQGGITFTIGQPKISYVEGACVGGGSEINSGLYHRTPSETLQAWAQKYDLKNSLDKDMDPYFKYCEQKVHVSPLPYPAPNSSLKLKAGADKLGWKVLEVPRWYDFEQKPDQSWTSTKRSMTRSFIPEALAHDCTLLDQTQVLKISPRGRGFEITTRHKIHKDVKIISADFIFLCAGATQTPLLLLKSGIKQNVGQQFQVHPTIKLVAEYNEPVNENPLEVPVHQVKEFSPHLSFGGSVSRPEHTALSLLNQDGSLENLKERTSKMMVYYAMIRPQSSGTIRSLPFSHLPMIKYPLAPEDISNLQMGTEKLSELLFESGATQIYPTISGFKQPISSPLRKDQFDFHRHKKDLQLMTIHLFSSCPMGENLKACVTNSYGAVHSYPGLFINDASLLCSAPGVNPQGSIMAFAYRNALHFLKKD